jgi:hypothetical protein
LTLLISHTQEMPQPSPSARANPVMLASAKRVVLL